MREKQTPGFCEFPKDYKEKYFKGLTAEEKREERQRNGTETHGDTSSGAAGRSTTCTTLRFSGTR